MIFKLYFILVHQSLAGSLFSPLSEIVSISPYGTILIPTYGKRISNSEIFQVQIKGRLSSPVTMEMLKNSIDASRTSTIPQNDQNDSFQNLVLRTEFMKTNALSSTSAAVRFLNADHDGRQLGPVVVQSGQDGIFQSNATIIPSNQDDRLLYQLDNVPVESYITLAEEEGFGVVSDIDDTIKITQVNSPIKALQNTFLERFNTTPGMPEYYKQLEKALEMKTSQNRISKPTFHYLSASPTQLVPVLQPFIEQNYPRGEIITNSLSFGRGIMGISDFTNVKSFKLIETRAILDFFPNRQFIMIGDSTQFDPEVYGQIAREFPNQVKCIMIRLVTGDNLEKEQQLNSKKRFADAFENVPLTKWTLFENPLKLDNCK